MKTGLIFFRQKIWAFYNAMEVERAGIRKSSVLEIMIIFKKCLYWQFYINSSPGNILTTHCKIFGSSQLTDAPGFKPTFIKFFLTFK